MLIGLPLKFAATRPFVALRDTLGLSAQDALPPRLPRTHLRSCQLEAIGSCACLWLTCPACQRGLHGHCMVGMQSPLLRTGFGIDCRCDHTTPSPSN